MARVRSLRTTLASATIIVTAMALLVTGALMELTSLLHRATSSASSAVESVRLAEEAEIDLLLHDRTSDATRRLELERHLRKMLVESRRFVATREEAALLGQAERAVNDYFEFERGTQSNGGRRTELLEATYGALEGLVAINVNQAEEAQRDAARWDKLGDAIGLGIGVLLVGVATWLIFWLKRRAFRPILNLADAMHRFARGERDARATESGPSELREMSTRFNEMATALAAQRSAQIAFLGGVAHDLRGPLGTLKLSIAYVAGQLPNGDPRLQRTVEIANRQIVRLERMVGDFIEITQVEAGQLELRPQPTDMCRLVRETVELFEGTLPTERVQLALPDGEVAVRCDPVRIEQVVSNLVSNAFKYSEGNVGIALEVAAGDAVLRVTDEGIGISAADQQHLFEPFRRLGLSRESVPGVGLGLFVVRRIVEAHGGRIAVTSAPGQGSTFRVHLPLAPAVANAPPPELRAGAGG